MRTKSKRDDLFIFYTETTILTDIMSSALSNFVCVWANTNSLSCPSDHCEQHQTFARTNFVRRPDFLCEAAILAVRNFEGTVTMSVLKFVQRIC